MIAELIFTNIIKDEEKVYEFIESLIHSLHNEGRIPVLKNDIFINKDIAKANVLYLKKTL